MRCPNNDCNLSFVLILQKTEFFRLKRDVVFEVRPTIVVHRSFKELVSADRKIRQDITEKNTVGVQASVETVNKFVDACPSICNIQSQTDIMAEKMHIGIQTEEVKFVSEISALGITEVECQNVFPTSFIKTEPVSTSPVRTMEVQQDNDDDDVMFIEIRPRIHEFPSTREIKQEENTTEDTVHLEKVIPEDSVRDVKDEPISEPVEQETSSSSISKELGDSGSSKFSDVADNHTASLNLSMLSQRSTVTSSSISQSIPTPRGRDTPSAAKRAKFSDVEMCRICWDVTFFTTLEEYCNHVQDRHCSVARFKCSSCERKFWDIRSGTQHLKAHNEDGAGNSISHILPEISEEHLSKFINVANQCYPETFRNTQSEKILDIINALP